MASKAVISSYTWRSLDSQKELYKGFPIFILPQDFSQLFRKTQRSGADKLYVTSLAVIANNEKDFRSFLAKAKERKSVIISKEDERTFKSTGSHDTIVKWWKDARRTGAAKIGARISATNKKKATDEAVEKIKGRWPLPSDEWPTQVLLDEAGLSLNTVKSRLGKRPIAQYNYQAAQKRRKGKK